jgi:hypothetical protein
LAALIRMMIVEMLEELGHRVVAEAGSLGRTVGPRLRIQFGVFDVNIGGFNISPIGDRCGISPIGDRCGSPIGDRCGAMSAVRFRQRLWAGWQVLTGQYA